MTRLSGFYARGVRQSETVVQRAERRAGGCGGRENPSQGVSKTRHTREEFPDEYDRKRCRWMS